MRLMTVWRITGKIISSSIIDIIGGLYNFLTSFLCFIKVKLSVKVKIFVSLLCVRAILPAKAVPEMTYTV